MCAFGLPASSCSWNGGLPKWPLISVPPVMIAAAASGCGTRLRELVEAVVLLVAPPLRRRQLQHARLHRHADRRQRDAVLVA